MNKYKKQTNIKKIKNIYSNEDELTNSEEEDDLSDRNHRENNILLIEKTNYDMNTPLVDGLIKVRNNYKTNSSSNHIAALIKDKNNFLEHYNSLTITKGINSDKTKYGNKNVKTHAEMDALNKTYNLVKRRKLKKGVKMSLIILRVNRNGKLCQSAPCVHCTIQLSKLKNIIIDKIYFSTDGEKIVSIKLTDWLKNPPQHITSGWRRLNKKNIEKRNT
jgi:hypothetical protein